MTNASVAMTAAANLGHLSNGVSRRPAMAYPAMWRSQRNIQPALA